MYSPLVPRLEDIKDPPFPPDMCIYLAVEGTNLNENRKYMGVPVLVNNMLLGFRKALLQPGGRTYLLVEAHRISDEITHWTMAQMGKTSYNETLSIRWTDIKGDTL